MLAQEYARDGVANSFAVIPLQAATASANVHSWARPTHPASRPKRHSGCGSDRRPRYLESSSPSSPTSNCVGVPRDRFDYVDCGDGLSGCGVHDGCVVGILASGYHISDGFVPHSS